MRINNYGQKHRRGGVHAFLMNREKVAGENFREGCMEVAFELWIEQRTDS